MPDCPWYITAHAVRQYLALTGGPVVSEGPAWDRAERELMDVAVEVMADAAIGIKQPKEIRPGLVRYRGPRPKRLTLHVATGARPEGDKPQLVDVLPSHDSGGLGGGRKDSPSRIRREERRRKEYEARRGSARQVASPAVQVVSSTEPRSGKTEVTTIPSAPQASVEVTATSDGMVCVEFRSPHGGWRQELTPESARRLAQSLTHAANAAKREKP